MCEQPIRVLVVNDEQTGGQRFVARLRDRGFSVVSASNEAEALQAAQDCAGDFQVALLRQQSKLSASVEIMRALHNVYPLIEFIIMTSDDDFVVGDEALQQGAYRYMNESMSDAELDMNIRTAVRFGHEHRLRGALETLIEAGQHLSSARIEEEVYQEVHDLARRLLPMVDTFLVASWDQLNEIVSFPFAIRDNVRVFPQSRQFDHNAKKITEYIIETAKPVFAPEGDRRFREVHQLAPPDIDGDAVSEIGVPVFWQGKVVGALLALSHHRGVYHTRTDLNALQALANQTAVSLQHVRNQEEATQLSQAVSQLVGRPNIEDLYSVIVREAHHLIAPDFTGLIVQDEDGRLRAVRPVIPESSFTLFEDPRQQGGVTRWVIDERRPRVIENTLNDPLVKQAVRDRGICSMLAMPLIHHDRVLGVLYAHSLRLRSFSDHDLSLWQAYAALAAAVLWSAREQSQDIQRYQELAAELAKLTGKLDLGETLQQIADTARSLTRAEACLLAHVDPATRAVTMWSSSPSKDEAERPKWSYRIPDDLAEHVLSQEKTLFFKGDATSQQLAGSLPQHPWRTLPLYSNGRLLAVLYCSPKSDSEFSPRAWASLEAFMAPAAMALRGATLAARQKRWQAFVEQIVDLTDRTEVCRRFTKAAYTELHAAWAVFLPALKRYDGVDGPDRATPIASEGLLDRSLPLDLTASLGEHLERLLQSPQGLLIVNELQQSGSDPGLPQALSAVRVQMPGQTSGEAEFGALVLGFEQSTSFDLTDLEVLRNAAERVAVVLNRLQLLEQRDRQLRAVQEVFYNFRHRLEPQTLLDIIAETYRSALDVDVCTVLAYTPEQGFTHRAAAGLCIRDASFSLPEPGVYRERFLEQPEPVLIEDAAVDNLLRHSGFIHREGIHTVVAYRLVADGTDLGLLFANYRRVRRVSDEERRAIRILGDIAAAVLRESRLQDQLSESERRLQRRNVLIWMSMLEDSWRHGLINKAAAIRNYATAARKRLRLRPGIESQDAIGDLDKIDHLAHEIADAPVRVPQSWEMQRELIRLRGLIEEVIWRTCRSAEAGSGVKYQPIVTLDELDGLQIWGYRRWLIYAMECLTYNALNAMPDGGTLSVSGRRNGEWVEVHIQDGGKGVAPSVQPYLFKALVPKEHHDERGRGVGALLAASIIEEHDGTVELEDTGPAGTTVLVWFKIAGQGA